MSSMNGRTAARSGLAMVAGLGLATSGAWAQADGAAAPADPGQAAAESPESIELPDIAALMRAAGASQNAAPARPRGDFPAWSAVSKGFEQVISAADGGSLYGIWVNNKTNEMLAELPRGYERQRHYFAMTVSGGDLFAGLQSGEIYAYWKRYDKRLALIQPNVAVRSSGDQESKDSVENIWTDRVLLDIPIKCMGPNGQPVIDMNNLLVGQAREFFGFQASGLNRSLARIASAKSFPENAELAFEVPDRTGLLKEFHYSISVIKNTPGYRPREADTRVGYFTTSYRDLGKFTDDGVTTRYINRWHVEKADPKRRMSPPKEPIVFYVEHTTPIRYRRWVREGVEYWNEAFRNIGIDGAIEVRYQDRASGAHMDKDPEDVRYNFIRWLSNDIGTAIGPSRVNPNTGEILDADVVLTDGWIRAFEYQWSDVMPDLATEGFSPELMGWLDKNPMWDPRLRLVSSGERDQIMAQRARRGIVAYGGHPAANITTTMMGENPYSGLATGFSQKNSLCLAAQGRALDLAMFRMHLDSLRLTMKMDGTLAGGVSGASAEAQPGRDIDEIPPEMLEVLKQQLAENPELIGMLPPELRAMVEDAMKPAEADEAADEDGDAGAETPKPERDDTPPSDMIDGMPEEFIGPALAELVAHEVGHTIGLRHNFKGSSAYRFDEINSEDMRGDRPWSTSVMDYNPINIRMPGYGDAQGDWAIIDIGPYDMWAIEYGYGFGDLDEVLARVAEPELQYATDEDTWGPDPYARRYDMAADPITYARNQVELIAAHREHLLSDFVDDGDSWAEARRGYQMTLGLQTRAISMMSNWIGGAHVYRDKKGDPNGRPPIEVVDAETQREALSFVIDQAFYDEAFGVDSELLKHLTVDKWWDGGSAFTDPTFPIHDRIMGIQASALTQVMNPITLQRVLDNEVFVPADEDAITLPEVLDTVTDAIWDEVLDASGTTRYSARNPMVSSMRRNLQREHLERLVDLTMPSQTMNSSQKPIANLATSHLRRLHGVIGDRLESSAKSRMDPYTLAHLEEAHLRIARALEAEYIYNLPAADLSGILGSLTFREGERDEE